MSLVGVSNRDLDSVLSAVNIDWLMEKFLKGILLAVVSIHYSVAKVANTPFPVSDNCNHLETP